MKELSKKVDVFDFDTHLHFQQLATQVTESQMAGMFKAYEKAVEVSKSLHTEMRGDGVTPYWKHPEAVDAIALKILSKTIPYCDSTSFKFYGLALGIVARWHDVLEDIPRNEKEYDRLKENLQLYLFFALDAFEEEDQRFLSKYLVGLVESLTNKDGEKYRDKVVSLLSRELVLSKHVKQADMLHNYSSIDSMRGSEKIKKSLRNKYEMGYYILTGRKIEEDVITFVVQEETV